MRRLGFESLEQRQLLSVAPISMSVSPGSALAGQLVYVEGDDAGLSNMTWKITSSGPPGLASDTVHFALYRATLAVTNMAPLRMETDQIKTALLSVSLIDVPQFALEESIVGGTASIVATDFIRGGNVKKAVDGTWAYKPHDTFRNGAPWDPIYPKGDAPGGDDGTAGGAMFRATIADKQGQRLRVNITLTDEHKGYSFYHRADVTQPAGKNWVDTAVQGKGGLMLVGGGDHPLDAYRWFGGQAAHGNIVVIANNKDQTKLISEVDSLFGEFGGAHAIDGFSFDVNELTDFLTYDAKAVVDDLTAANAGTGLSHEFIDKLKGAEGVYFCGGDQWPYVQVLVQGALGGNLASQVISGRNLGDKLVVGGTSAGLAILGKQVFSAKWGGVDSLDMLQNAKNASFEREGKTAIVADVLTLKFLAGKNVLTETHFTDPKKESLDLSGHQVYRLGRFMEFLGSLGNTAKGIAVDDSTALTINNDGKCNVYGSKAVYFAKADPVISSITVVGQHINYVGMDLRHWLATDNGKDGFDLDIAWNFDALNTERVSVENGVVSWLDAPPHYGFNF